MFLLNLLLALAWLGLTGEFTPMNFAIGFGLAYGLLWLVQSATRGPGPSSGYFGRAWRTVEFVLFFLWELVLANLRVAVDILRPQMRLQPAVVAIPLEADSTPAQITLLANLITLTPGTLSLDVSADRRTLYVHTMHADDDVEAFRRDIKEQFERRVREVLS